MCADCLDDALHCKSVLGHCWQACCQLMCSVQATPFTMASMYFFAALCVQSAHDRCATDSPLAGQATFDSVM
jgi:hypothetical protein